MLSALIASLGLVAVPSAEVEQGYTLRVYDIGRPLDRVARVAEDATPNIDRLEDRIDFNDESTLVGPGGPTDFFAVEALGFLSIETAGEYVFELRSDDGGRLEIDGKPVIVHDGVHPPHPSAAHIQVRGVVHGVRNLALMQPAPDGGLNRIQGIAQIGAGQFPRIAVLHLHHQDGPYRLFVFLFTIGLPT